VTCKTRIETVLTGPLAIVAPIFLTTFG
jgi:hypothetical protein